MMNITIIFSTYKKYNPIFLWFRKLLLNQSSTHVSFGIEKDGKPIIFHMSGKGAIRTPRDRFVKKNYIIQEFEIIPDLSNELQTHLKYLGTPYDANSAFWQLVAAIIRPLKQFLIYFKIRNKFYCANFARQLDANDKIVSWRHVDKQWASVDELQHACQNSNEFRLL
jgi:hypothetical protein